MMIGMVALARLTGVQFVEDPASQLVGAPAGYYQKTVIAQLARGGVRRLPARLLRRRRSPPALILVLACNTAFNGFPVLGSILAQDRLPAPPAAHPRRPAGVLQRHRVPGRLRADPDRRRSRPRSTALIQLYIVGVFVSFTLSQAGMIRHWNRLLRTERDPARPAPDAAARRRSTPSAFCFTGVVLVIVLITKFLAGAWIAIVAMAVIFVTMRAIKRHYDRVARELAADEDDMVLPSRIHAIVLVSKLHLPTMRALAYARATRPDTPRGGHRQRRPGGHRATWPGSGRTGRSRWR